MNALFIQFNNMSEFQGTLDTMTDEMFLDVNSDELILVITSDYPGIMLTHNLVEQKCNINIEKGEYIA